MTKSSPTPLSSSSRSETWPAERFYWSVVDCPGRMVPMSGTLLLLMEDDFPVEGEHLHAVGVRLDDRRVLACAAAREELSSLDPSIAALTPASVPNGVPGGELADPGLLNLLLDEFEPAPLRRERGTRTSILFGTLTLLTLVAALGLWRRAAIWSDAARDMDAQARHLLASTAVSSEPGRSMAEQESLLDQELARLRQTRWTTSFTSGEARVRDASDALAGYLALWPLQAKVRTDFLSVTPTSIALSLRTVREEGTEGADAALPSDPTSLVAKLPRPTGWIMDEPRLTARDGNTSLAIQLRRERSGGAP